MKKPKIAVIMATYNGEKFLDVQLESILAQKDVEVSLFIYDDQSKDSTMKILDDYMKKHKNIKARVNAENKRSTKNFLDALFEFKDNKEFDYYAFADQDDYWKDDKLITAIKFIEKTGKCTMYSSNLKVVDRDLVYKGHNVLPAEYEFSHYDEICYNMVTGCTCVFDKAFKDLATKHYPIDDARCHDYWLGLIACYCKESNYVYNSDSSYILYRQHGNNVVGAKKMSLSKRIHNFLFKKEDQIIYMLKLLHSTYNDELDEKDKEIIEKFIDYRKGKNKKFLTKNMKCNFNFKLKIRLLFNKFK